jgi:BA14K-like protein
MELNMNGFKILSACAVFALIPAWAAPAASLADPHGGKGSNSGFHGSKGHHRAGTPVAHFSDTDPGYRGTFISGSVVGAVGFYDNGYYEDAPVAVVQGPGGNGGDTVAYCTQTYKSYQPRSGTYLGYDGQRHPCP